MLDRPPLWCGRVACKGWGQSRRAICARETRAPQSALHNQNAPRFAGARGRQSAGGGQLAQGLSAVVRGMMAR